MPGEFPDARPGLLPAPDAGLGASLLPAGAHCVSAVHPADHLQEAQVSSQTMHNQEAIEAAFSLMAIRGLI